MNDRLFFGKLFKWNPDKNGFTGIILGIIIIFLSVIMIYTKKNDLATIIIRDYVMILFFGTGLPLFLINRQSNFKKFGLHFDRWYILLPINLVLAILLLLLFLKESPLPTDFVFSYKTIWNIIYIMLAGIFETIVFYSYIRTVLEDSFGIIPAIMLAAVFYSFHHAGFQPEFGKLLLVGILYASVYRIGNSAILIFPFFWGIGGCYDVLIQSDNVSEIIYPEIRAVLLLIGVCSIFTYMLIKHNKSKKIS